MMGESTSFIQTGPQVDPAGSFLGVKRRQLDFNHPPPSGAEIKKVWSYTSASIVCLHGRLKGLFIVYFIYLFLCIYLFMLFIYLYLFIYTRFVGLVAQSV